ncbi:MAG: hypothetical protein WDN66_00425 [Candidatus Saccharibacteria bacterium]
MAIISAENKGIQPLTPHQMPLVELGAAAISLERGRYHDIVVASTSYGTNLPEGLQLFLRPKISQVHRRYYRLP